MRTLALAVTLLVGGLTMAQAKVVMKAATVDTTTARQLIVNGDLEQVADKGFVNVTGWVLGYEVDDEVKHGGQFSARCRNATAEEHRGLTHQVTLNQTQPIPIVAECWSRAQDVSGGQDSNYSLYLDLVYTDGTPLWGQVATFKPGTHDWQKRTVVVAPAKPIRSVSVHGIFRGRSGTAWFDDFKLWELSGPGGVKQFDGVSVLSEAPSGIRAVGAPNGKIAAAMFVRDVADASDFHQPDMPVVAAPDGESASLEGTVSELGLALKATYTRLGDSLRIDGEVRDLQGKDRAVTVYCAVPVDAVGWQWHDDQSSSRTIEAGAKYHNPVSVRAGATGMAAHWPLACVSGPTSAMSLAVPLDVPRLCRLAYDADWKQLYAAFDVGLSQDHKDKGSATFSLVVFPSDPKWGFRAALKRTYELFPQCFTKRNRKEGIWMPFADIAKVEGFQDFGFQFKEGNNNPVFDEQNGIDTYVYVEPASHWLRMPPEMPRTIAAAQELIREQAAKGEAASQATLSSALQDPDGDWYGSIEKAPWCDGALFYNNPAPSVQAEGTRQFDTRWNSIQRAMDSAQKAGAPLEGTYLDSFEMAATLLNYRRSHFSTAQYPLVFDMEGRVCQMEIFNSLEFAQEIARRMWGQNLTTFANSTPHSFAWGAAWLDIMGTETNWARGGQYAPPPAATLNYWRGVCYQRPYLLLQNTDFDAFKPEWVELYMKRSCAWGLFPGFFSHNASEKAYFTQPALYNRDRHLFLKYIPVIKRLSAAGWEPVTGARASDELVRIERFGKPGGPLMWTMFNDSAEPRTTTVTVEAEMLSGAGDVELRELLTGKTMTARRTVQGAEFTATVEPQDVWVLAAPGG